MVFLRNSFLAFLTFAVWLVLALSDLGRFCWDVTAGARFCIGEKEPLLSLFLSPAGLSIFVRNMRQRQVLSI